MLLSLGKAMSGAPIINGTNQLPKPPIIAGMTMKKIMITACEVKKTLYMFLAASIDPSPGHDVRDHRKHLDSREHQLRAYRDRQQRADHAGADRENEIERADVLVVG